MDDEKRLSEISFKFGVICSTGKGISLRNKEAREISEWLKELSKLREDYDKLFDVCG